MTTEDFAKMTALADRLWERSLDIILAEEVSPQDYYRATAYLLGQHMKMAAEHGVDVVPWEDDIRTAYTVAALGGVSEAMGDA